MEQIYWMFPFQGSGLIAEKGVEILQELEDVNEYKWSVSSGHSRAVTHMNSLQL